ncbi:cellulase family glycosylhydrolase [Marinoscillum sp. 108]|uniref:cellulase family glycosylhydrolase n=1 Tax=Marinoscillum sp. 108 TaxID=2653151 RepID=UPI0012F06745|nr:cellulase family glycosylhydrolase [Marinoscillum sp. 108]VXD13516.1 Xyloglucan-specific endo-beta-1,4-glucanase BoGH5A [Marinoscillum sp. 108]
MIDFFRYLLLTVKVLLLLQFSACAEKGDPKPDEGEVHLSVDKSSLAFGSDGGVEEINISSNAIWKLEYPSGTWVRASLQSTKGDATVKITVDKNETTEQRQLDFKLSAQEAESINISVTQEASEETTTSEEPELADFVDPDNSGMRNMTSLELSQEMGLGWNLGNSMEAISANNGELSGGETSWGNPVVTKALIDAVKAAGFNTIRIPVSWSHKMEDAETYHISYEWKLRVEEVVNYALDNEMYVLINIHWDGGWMDSPIYDDQDYINDRIAIMWKQIAKFFRNYDDHLLFAGTNEVHMSGEYGEPSAEYAEVQNSFNQTFVNAVRATGGRNSYRHLVVQTYNTNIGYGVRHFSFPADEIGDRLMVEVHFYDPYQFALEENGSTYLWGAENAGNAAHSGWGDQDWIDEAFGDVKTYFVDMGYPVILGEYGAILRTELPNSAYELHIESRNAYLTYVTRAAVSNGMIPVYWDNGYTGNNGFGLFNRNSGEVVYEDALQAIISAN